MKKIVYLLIILILSMNVHSTGVSVSGEKLGYNIKFKPGLEREFTFEAKVINPSASRIGVTVYDSEEKDDGTSMNLSEYFYTDESEITLTEEDTYAIKLKMKLPDRIDEPGVHQVRMRIYEIKSQTKMIGAVASVAVFFNIHVAYDGQYLKASLDAKGVNNGEDMPVELNVNNLGTVKIDKLYSDISLRDSSNKTVAEKRTQQISLGSQESQILKETLSTKYLMPGEYTAKSIIYHDNEITNLFDKVRIGELKFRITNNTQEAYFGKINQIFVEAESLWAEPVQNVYAEIYVAGRPAVKSISQDFEGFQKRKLIAYIDTTGLNPGSQDMRIKIHYGDKEEVKETTLMIIEENIRNPFSNMNITSILIVIIMFMLLTINMILFVMLMRKKEEYEKEN